MINEAESSHRIRIGAIISYATIALNIIAGLIYTPWMIAQIGQSNYGLYILATSFITMFMMDFGMSAAVSRFISKAITEGNQNEVNNILGIVYKLYFVIDLIIIAVLTVLYFFINRIYGQLTPDEVTIFRNLYIVVGLYNILTFPFLNLNGVLTSYELFVPLKVCDIFHRILTIAIMVVVLCLGRGIYALVLVNAISGMLTVVLKQLVIRIKTPARANFRAHNYSLLKRIFSFSIWTTVISISQRLVFNITPSVIAAVSVTGASGVSIFGLGSTIEGYVYTFAAALSGMFMPKITRIIYGEHGDRDLTPLAIKVGRLQCMIIGLLVAGIIGVGQSFIIDIWGKPDYAVSYYCAILLVLPNYFYLPLEIANTAIMVANKLNKQASVFVITGVVNLILAVVLSENFGAIGASLSIFLSYSFRTVLMLFVYKNNLNIQMSKFIKNTYIPITPVVILAAVLGLLSQMYLPVSNPVFRFLISGTLIVAVYTVALLCFVCNTTEKGLMLSFVKAIKSGREGKTIK